MIDLPGVLIIVERIMTQHWDGFGVCQCWICQEGREYGAGPKSFYLPHNRPDQARPAVTVERIETL